MPADVMHPVVAERQPDDPNIKVWRFMDVTKLVALLETCSLHFSRAGEFADPFEGSLALMNKITNEITIAEILRDQHEETPSEMRYTRDQLREIFSQMHRDSRQWVFINCWHGAESESLAMWRLYGSDNGSVVVQTTYKKLKEALPTDVFIDEEKQEKSNVYLGMVEYKDYLHPSKGLKLDANILAPFMHKRLAYEYEKEVRAFLTHIQPASPSIMSVDVDIDVGQLIESIRVRPGTPEWELRTIERLVRKYGLDTEVIPSEIDASPMF